MARRIRVSRSLALVALLAACAPASAPRTPRPSADSADRASLASAPDRFLTSGAARIRYRDIGRGEPVVLLHGITRSLEEWLAVADSLARERRVIALDLRGSGRSTGFRDRSRYGAAIADDVVHLLDHLRIPRAHLVGHSMGAVVAANVAARYPDRVASAALLAPPIYPDSAGYMRANAGFVTDLEQGRGMARMIQWVFPGTSRPDAAAASAAILAATPPERFAPLLASLSALMVPPERMRAARVPALVAGGTGDPFLPQARWLASIWPGARLIELSGANHDDVVARPEVWSAVRMLMRAHPITSAGRERATAHGRSPRASFHPGNGGEPGPRAPLHDPPVRGHPWTHHSPADPASRSPG